MVAMNGTKFTFRGLENIPKRGGALLAQTTPASSTGSRRCSPYVNAAGGCTS
jgi:hypothetical protein